VTLQASTISVLSWVTNPHSNGSGQEQFAVDPDDPSVLYVWDSTLASVFRMDRNTGAFDLLAAFDPGVGAGLHLQTHHNDVAFDATRGTLLVTDGINDRVLELDPSTSPAILTTVFSGLPETPHAIALTKNHVYVEAGFDSIYVGRRHGHHPEMRKLIDGFTFLTDIAVRDVGDGTELLAVDKTQDILYRVAPCDSDDDSHSD
jgi:hypothetical protein